MTVLKTYYQILQVDRTASPEVIRAAYRRLARMYHPDANSSPDAVTKMHDLNGAYEVLSDRSARAVYDAKLYAAERMRAAPRSPEPAESTQRNTSDPKGTLKYHRRSTGYVIFRIEQADDLHSVLRALKAGIPNSARTYNATKMEWRVSVAYEGVLRALFSNYPSGAPAQRRANSAPPSSATCETAASRQKWGSRTSGRFGLGVAVMTAGLVTLGALSGVGGSSDITSHQSLPTRMPTATLRAATVSSALPTPPPSATPARAARTPTRRPSPSPTPSSALQPLGCTPDAAFWVDVTIPDNTAIAVGTSFVKKWRIKNTGTCEWDNRFLFTFVDGDRMRAPVSVPVEQAAPDEVLDVAVELVAPSEPGTYRGDWQMCVAEECFGPKVYVLITAYDPATP